MNRSRSSNIFFIFHNYSFPSQAFLSAALRKIQGEEQKCEPVANAILKAGF
jgi:hypothetical protein